MWTILVLIAAKFHRHANLGFAAAPIHLTGKVRAGRFCYDCNRA
jgi:hypothetical protein